MKTKIALTLGILILFIVPMISADLITPGYKSISITNRITNINDFQDYVFVSGPTGSPGPTCDFQIIERDGIIPKYYKFCQISVYAIKKSDFNQEEIDNLNTRNDNFTEMQKLILEFENSDKVKLVIENVDIHTIFPITSTRESIENQYIINLNTIKSKPDKVITGRNNLLYFYIIVPIVALALIILIIVFRRKK